jgi:acyl carrier protein
MPDILTIEKDIKGFITGNILASNLDITTDTILQDVGMDSYSVVEIILFVERKYKLQLPNEALLPQNFESIKAIAATVNGLM